MVMGRVVWGGGRDTLTGTAGVRVWTSGMEASVAAGCRPGPAEAPLWVYLHLASAPQHQLSTNVPSAPAL